jgi:hypothetical protein
MKMEMLRRSEPKSPVRNEQGHLDKRGCLIFWHQHEGNPTVARPLDKPHVTNPGWAEFRIPHPQTDPESRRRPFLTCEFQGWPILDPGRIAS